MTYENSSVYSTFKPTENTENFHYSLVNKKKKVDRRPGRYSLMRMTWIAKDRKGI